MLDSLYIGASGMHAQQLNIDVVANNLANVNTSGYKRNRIDFEDLLYRNVIKANGLIGSADNVHRLGVGAAITSTDKVFTLGDIKKTDGALDFAIRGQGFFEVALPDGSRGYTRSGAFQVNRDGLLTTSDGNLLTPSIQVPADASSVSIDVNGRVFAKVANESQPIEIGQLELANFMNPGGLNPLGSNLYVPTQKSGDAVSSIPGENGLGTIAQGFLESSNVKLVEEMINLIIAQRAYEINAKVVQASDELLSISNNLRR